MFEFSLEPPKDSVCACCGKPAIRLTRFVTQDGKPFAVYFAQFTPGHSEKRVNGLMGLGRWDEKAAPKDRVAIAFQISHHEEKYKVALVEANHTPWHDAGFLGKALHRDEALHHKLRDELFHITDRIVIDDSEVVKYFAG